MKASSHQPTTGIHADESKTASTSQRKRPSPTKRMGTNPTTFKPKRDGHISRKDMGKNRGKRRNEPSNNALRGIRTTRRIHATGQRRRKTERYMRS